MKSYALVATKNYLSFKPNNDYFNFCWNFLKEKSNCKIFVESSDNFNSLDYEGLIVFSNELQNDYINSIKNKVLEFHKQSKPIAAISLAGLQICSFLKTHAPLVAITDNENNLAVAHQMKINFEICPAEDYISDRDCKLLSNISDHQFETDSKKCFIGLNLLLKEFWEIS